ncbi:MAG TPA: hypothetical protein ENH87_11165 [Pricia antarctica]|uniref:Uncharacterized protein n=1 Tax=Pricia antarctica TaxID=641691 RepID=A0A831VRZ5_9FLAO|nr:hypothetical protein [Pricia antarctica]
MCNRCDAIKTARQDFKRYFTIKLTLDRNASLTETVRYEKLRTVKKTIEKGSMSIGTGNMETGELKVFCEEYHREFRLLETNPGRANGIIHFDPIENKFIKSTIYWFDEMRFMNILRMCGNCVDFQCSLVKNPRMAIVNIQKCSKLVEVG